MKTTFILSRNGNNVEPIRILRLMQCRVGVNITLYVLLSIFISTAYGKNAQLFCDYEVLDRFAPKSMLSHIRFVASSFSVWVIHLRNAPGVNRDHSMMTSSNGNIFRVTGPLCGEFTGPGEFPTQRPVTRSFHVFFDLRLNKQFSKQPWGWWFETPSWSLWRQCNTLGRCGVCAPKHACSTASAEYPCTVVRTASFNHNNQQRMCGLFLFYRECHAINYDGASDDELPWLSDLGGVSKTRMSS